MEAVESKTHLSKIEPRQRVLEQHEVFKSIQNMEDLQLFMTWHVFAVWDFMSLIKRLQLNLTSVDLPWVPSPHPLAARLINEIVLGEESDEVPGGGFLSHYEIYLLAMKEVGAQTNQIEEFVSLIRAGTPYTNALEIVSAPKCIQAFVTSTMETVKNGNVYEVLGSFFYGRENVIPQMFNTLLASWQIDATEAPMFVYYLKRHIELDGDTHGPAALKIINELTSDNLTAIQQLADAAEKAINSRITLWDGLATELTNNNRVTT
ncbi:DUF3050 domain-containing protein [Sulfurirhabdus autotrophica]|uniref:DUF3050 family protein n=1 Tax=Sulfurirhabdus autotrophica TaxID=1706046 RepID=A0A4R3YDX9_9PROT|nr:DUF3050 domain-containing protein [Sulfurirhabdus autotrophica]TCV90240.1 DUF3050 family protein [Sulfurirhabdus autotrophica]